MADPLSIVAGSIGLADVCIRTIHSLRRLQKDVENVDDDLAALVEEVDGLGGICRTVQSMFSSGGGGDSLSPSSSPSDDDVPARPGQSLCTHLDRTLQNCHAMVAKLDGIVAKIRGHNSATLSSSGPVSTGKIDSLKMAIRKRLHEGDLRNCRVQLATYQNALHLVVTMITLQKVGDSSDETSRSCGDLSQDIRNLDSSLQTQLADLQQQQQQQRTAGAAGEGLSHYDAAALAALKELRESVSSAVTTIEKAPSNRFFDIPQSVSSIFTGRDELLQELRRRLIPRTGLARDKCQRRFIVYGLGGSGKTQFCCKFAQDNRDSFWGVFWIDASTPERVKQTLGDIAERAGVERNEAAALHWLSSLDRKWLLIIDNADDDNVPLERYFPKGNRGTILVTTRNPAYKVHGNVAPGFYEFQGLGLDEATRLLLKACGQPPPWDETCEALALTISRALGFLALAIIHAGAAISDKLCSLKDYLDYFSRSWRRIRSARLVEKGSTSEAAVYATWEICYDRLEQRRVEGGTNDAIQLLNTLAFLHWESISPHIFVRAIRNAELEAEQEAKRLVEEKEEQDKEKEMQGQASSRAAVRPPGTWGWRWLGGVSLSAILSFLLGDRGPAALPGFVRDGRRPGGAEDSEDRLRLALKELTQMSLIMHNDHSDTYLMHPIVHMWARERPRMSLADQALWADVAGRVLSASILLPPLGTTAADERFHASLLPHVQHVQSKRDFAASRLSQARRIGGAGGGGAAASSSSWISPLVPALTPDVARLAMYARFSLVLAKCGHWDEAEVLISEVAAFLHRHLGPAHKRTRQATLFLSTVLWHKGEPAAAAVLQSGLVETCTAHLGPSHPDTLRAMGELGRTRWQQGQYTAARLLQEEVLRQLTLRLPTDHADTLEAMDNLGLTLHKFWETHHFEEAHRLHAAAAAGMSRVHGRDHPRTLVAKENLCRVAVMLGGARHVAPALAVMTEVLDARRARMGREHPYTLLAMANKAIVLSAAGRLAEAEALVREGLPVAERNLGAGHIGTLFGRHTLATVLSLRGRHAEAEALLRDVAERQRRMAHAHRGGDHHPDRLAALIELARCCFAQGKVDDAVDVCDEAIRGFDAISAVPHPLAASLRVARMRMLGRDPMDRHHGVTFPFVLFRPCDETLVGN